MKQSFSTAFSTTFVHYYMHIKTVVLAYKLCPVGLCSVSFFCVFLRDKLTY